MLSALAPSGPVAPAVPTSPPSTTASTQPVQRESFKDVYGQVSTGDDSKSDSGPKQKAIDSNGNKLKKTAATDGSDKPAAIATPSPQGAVLQNAPLGFVFLGQEAAAQTVSDQTPGASEDKAPADSQAGNPAVGADATASSPSVAGSAPNALSPANEKQAFSMRLTQPDALPRQAQMATVSTAPPARPAAGNQARTASGPAAAPAEKDATQAVDSKKALTPDAVSPVRETPSATAPDLRATPAPSMPSQTPSAASSRTLAIHDIQPGMPDLPKPPASTEILLQVAGQDHSSASVRVVDRMGTVNVTVHAADPELRTSLRSNLNELASQLSTQGYKTEIAKPAVLSSNAENQHDSRHGNQDSTRHQQHQSAPDGRPPQRDRRSNAEQWRDEFVQETSGKPGIPGGKS